MPRYWLALFFGYNGQGYNGMQHQKQEHVLSVENEIIPLLHKAGFLPTDNYTELQRKYKYSRAARTDKGVHAVVNGISCEFHLDKKYFHQDSMLNKQMLHLQLTQAFQNSNVHFHCFKRVTTRFQMRHLIHSRSYSYICPLNYFKEENKTIEQTLQKLNKCCKQFVGTHNFHNYSRDLKAKDPEAKRYIMSFTAELFGTDMEFVKFEIEGQSFVYNQIRKMIGGIVFVFVNNYEAQFISNTFFRNQFYLPIAPANGLYLKGIDFKAYNNKKQIPEKIEFQEEHVKKSMRELEGQIEEFISKTDNEVWDSWYNQVKQGKIIMPDDDYQGQKQKGQGA